MLRPATGTAVFFGAKTLGFRVFNKMCAPAAAPAVYNLPAMCLQSVPRGRRQVLYPDLYMKSIAKNHVKITPRNQ